MTSSPDRDKTQFGTSAFAKAFLDRDDVKRYFPVQQVAIKFAASIALRNNLAPAPRDSTFVNAHNIFDVDDSGQLRALVKTKYPKDPPVTTIEGLAESGFRFLDEQMKRNGMTIGEFFE